MLTDKVDSLQLTASVVCNYLSQNRLPAEDIADFICSVHAALVDCALKKVTKSDAVRTLATAAQSSHSIRPNYLICFECGSQLKSLKYHLKKHGLTPQAYRVKWGLPLDYPKVAPNLSAKRKALAKASRFGHGNRRKRRQTRN
jgi:predicted transcriptional regulator